MKPLTEIYLDRRRKKKDGTYPVKLKITLIKDREYYKTPYSLTEHEFEEVNATKPKKDYKDTAINLGAIEQKAIDVIKELGDAFTFENFNRLYLKNRSFRDSLEAAFDDYTADILEYEPDRIGTIEVYNRAKISLLKYSPKAKLGDVTVRFLQGYEAWMKEQENSPTTTGIYCRHLRSVINTAMADGRLSKELYPFGKAKDKKFEIPTSANTKKALTLDDVSAIYNYSCESGNEEMSRDYWIFLYFCNGLNLADFCRLRWGDVDNGRIIFIREKTTRTRKVKESIHIIIQEDAQAIMDKWGTKMISKEGYIFSHIEQGMDEQMKQDTVHKLNWVINKYMKRIAETLGINKPVTTYAARHSFATILQNSGAPVAMISKALGHSSIVTTQKYLGSFETDQLKDATAALSLFKKINGN
jgi:integrase/recombinase XerD